MGLEAFEKFYKSSISIDNILGTVPIWLILDITILFPAAGHDSNGQKGNGNCAKLSGNIPFCTLAPVIRVLILNCTVYLNSHGPLKV